MVEKNYGDNNLLERTIETEEKKDLRPVLKHMIKVAGGDLPGGVFVNPLGDEYIVGPNGMGRRTAYGL